MKTIRRAIALGSCLVLTGCALHERMRDIVGMVDQAGKDISSKHEQFTLGAGQAARRAAQQVDRPWLAGKAQPLARELALPSALRHDVNVTLMFADGPLELPAIAQRITAITAIPVYISPESLLPHAHFLPRLAMADTPVQAMSIKASLSGQDEPLSQVLDRVGARLGVMWRYENNRIEFYRTLTRVFNVRALTWNADSEASLGQGGSAAAEGFGSTSRTRLASSGQDTMAVVQARLQPFLSRAGVVVAEPGASSTVVVTDTPQVLKRIEHYLDQENRAITRRVRIVFEEITVAVQDSTEAGIDWNIVFSSARAAVGAMMPGTALAEAAAIGARAIDGPFNGTEAIVKALNQVGRVVRRSSVPMLTLNRRPVTHAVRTTFSYIDKVQTTALGDGAVMSLPSVSVSQREQTVGSVLTLVPDAQDDGQVLLSVAYDNTVAQPLKTITFGDRSNPLQLQQLTVDGNGSIQQLALQPGQPFVISGFDRSQSEAQSKRISPDSPLLLGGKSHATEQRLSTVVIVTAHVEEGY